MIACTFCDVTGPSTGALTAHLRRFIPELRPFTQYRKVRTYPSHPVRIIREYVRLMGKNPWTERLDPIDPTQDASETEVLIEFGRMCATMPDAARIESWGEREYEAVSNAAWGDMLDQAVAAYAAKRDTPKMRAHVRRLVMRAIEKTFVEKEHDEPEVSDAEVEDARARGLELRGRTIAEQPTVIERGYDDDAGIDVNRDEDYEDEPVRPHRLRTRKRDVYIDSHPTASNTAGGDMLNQDIRGKKVRLDLGIKNVINVPAAGARPSRAPVSNGPPIDPRMFDDFPLIYLVVHILGAVVRVPAQYNTTLAEVLGAVEKHPENPIRLLGLKGAFAGRGQWLGVWDDAVWRKVKQEAGGLDAAVGKLDPTHVEYHVDFVLDQKAMAGKQ